MAGIFDKVTEVGLILMLPSIMDPKIALRFLFTLVTIVLLLVIGFNIASHTKDADIAVMASQTP